MGRHIEELPTPALLIDLDVLERNCNSMLDRCRGHNISLRPHQKSHKCIEVTRRMLRGVPQSEWKVTVSTLAEAEYFADYGVQDILWAFPLPVDTLQRVLRLHKRIERLCLMVDNVETVRILEQFWQVAKAAKNKGREREAGEKGSQEAEEVELRPFRVFLKLDTGYGRAGVDPKDPRSLQLAAAIHASSALELEGVYSHSGHSYSASSRAEVLAIAEQERSSAVSFARELQAQLGGACSTTVSVGSTPVAALAGPWPGCSELHPGNYCFFDCQQAALGSCRLEDVAVSVLATVAGAYPKRQQLLVNAGGTALHKDPAGQRPFGCVLGHPDLVVASISQEHGLIKVGNGQGQGGGSRGGGGGDDGGGGIDFDKFPLGSRVRILPNHSCMTAAQHDTYYIVRGDEVVDEWKPCKGW